MGYLADLGRTNALAQQTQSLTNLALGLRESQQREAAMADQKAVNDINLRKAKFELDKAEQEYKDDNTYMSLDVILKGVSPPVRQDMEEFGRSRGWIEDIASGANIKKKHVKEAFEFLQTPEGVKRQIIWETKHVGYINEQLKMIDDAISASDILNPEKSGKGKISPKDQQALVARKDQLLAEREQVANSIELLKGTKPQNQTRENYYVDEVKAGRMTQEEMDERISKGKDNSTVHVETTYIPIDEDKYQYMSVDKVTGETKPVLKDGKPVILTEKQVLIAEGKKAQSLVNPFETKFMGELGESEAKRLSALRTTAHDAVVSKKIISEGLSLIDQGIYSGSAANIKLKFDKWLQEAGVNIGGQTASNTEAYAGIMGLQVGKIIKAFGSGTGLSDADREYAQKIAAGEITLTEQSLRKLLDINSRLANFAIFEYNSQAERSKQMMSEKDYFKPIEDDRQTKTREVPDNKEPKQQSLPKLDSKTFFDDAGLGSLNTEERKKLFPKLKAFASGKLDRQNIIQSFMDITGDWDMARKWTDYFEQYKEK